MNTPAQEFLNFYERCLEQKQFTIIDYFKDQFGNQSPIKYHVKYHSNTETLLISLCNAILKNLDLN